ncbi:MAG: type VI secretion system baseplate subunit TssK [Gemmatimonadota bacterium]
MRLLSSVVWSEGMHLAPQHFQTQGRYFEDLQHFTLSSLFFGGYGLAGLEMDQEALRNGTVALLHARGIMPDGLPFNFPHDPLPDPVEVRDLFSPTAQSHRVLLAIPPYRASAPNCATETNGRPGDVRYLSSPEPVRDALTGQDEQAVPLARKNFRLLLDVEAEDGEGGDEGSELVTLPVARVRRDGSGNFIYDPDFIPPGLKMGASRGLTELVARLVDLLEARARTLADERRAGLDRDRDYGPQELLGYWFTHALNSNLPLLRHHLATRSAHPERLFADLSVLAGALSTFSLTGDVNGLPLYDHADPGEGFRTLEREIRRCLDTVMSSNAVRLPVGPGEAYFHAVGVSDRRVLAKGAHWFVGLRSGARRDEIISGVPRLVKICSAKHIRRLVKEAYPGLELEHAPTLPAGLSPRVGTEYFRVRRTDPCWASISDTGEVGIYVPGAFPDPELEIVVLLDDAAAT